MGKIIHLFLAMVILSATPCLSLQKKYSDPLDERAGWYEVHRSGGEVTVTSQKSNLWKLYAKIGEHVYVIQRMPDSNNWYVIGKPVTPGSEQYLLTQLRDDVIDLSANNQFTLNINGKISEFTVDLATRQLTIKRADGSATTMSPKIPGESPSRIISSSGGEGPSSGTQEGDENTDDQEGYEDTGGQDTDPVAGGGHNDSVPLCQLSGTCGGSTSSSSSSSSGGITGSSSSGGGGSSGEPVAAPTGCTGSSKTWDSDLTVTDMGKDSTFFGVKKSRWPVVAGVYGSRGSKPGMMNGAERLRTGLAPDGTPSILNYVPEGEVQNWNFYLNNFGGGGVKKVRAGMSMLIPQGFTWGHDQKLALGIWGGKLGCLSGGCAIGTETGFSIRMVHSPASGAKLYSYHLNREQRSGVAGKSFGNVVGKSTGPIPQGVWNRFELELLLNDPGVSNGELKFFMNGKQVGTTVVGLMYREDPSWLINGFFVNDMWGGTEEADENQSPRIQQYWYSNYSISGCN